MVRQGKDKKRRSGRTGRTKLKNRNYKRWNPKPAFTDPVIKAQWNAQKTYAQNMKEMGLVSKPGQAVEKDSQETQQQNTVIELYEVPDSDVLEARKKKRPQSAQDQKYIAKLLTKHGDDYTAMFRDIKVNNMQHTEAQLRKMASRFLLLDEEQRVVDVPERIKTALTQEDENDDDEEEVDEYVYRAHD